MLEKIILYGYEVEIDKDATKEWYAHAEEWGCECDDCLNFLELAKRELFPRPIIDMLRSLDIPPAKATYVCQLTESNGNHLYQFSYRIAGNILHAPSKDTVHPVGEEGLCCHETYPYGAPDFPTPHFDLEYIVEMPWALEKSRCK